MGWFLKSKCSIHQIERKIGKDDMCQRYYYCPKCVVEAQKTKDIIKRVESLERVGANKKP